MPEQNEEDSFDSKRLSWEFFKLHAIQRVTFFRFYISAIIALFAAYFYIYDHLRNCESKLFLYLSLIFVGLGIIAISSVFCRIDRRNVELINNAKNESDEIKKLSRNENDVYRHLNIFRTVFSVTGIIGITLSIIGGYKLGLDTSKCDLLQGGMAYAPSESRSNSKDDESLYKDNALKDGKPVVKSHSQKNLKVQKNRDITKKSTKSEYDDSTQ